jgi:hypothetical protein
LQLLSWSKWIAGFFGIGTSADVTLSKLVDQSQGTANVVKTLLDNPTLVGVVSVSGAVIALCAILELLHADDYNRGAYTPSKLG